MVALPGAFARDMLVKLKKHRVVPVKVALLQKDAKVEAPDGVMVYVGDEKVMVPVGVGAAAVIPVVVGVALEMLFCPMYPISARVALYPSPSVRLLLNVLVPVQVLLSGNKLVTVGTGKEFRLPDPSTPRARVGVALVMAENWAVVP